jgi:hypothetical protein
MQNLILLSKFWYYQNNHSFNPESDLKDPDYHRYSNHYPYTNLTSTISYQDPKIVVEQRSISPWIDPRFH